MTPAQARQSSNFQKWEYEAKQAQEKLDEITRKIYHHFPLEDGFWVLMANGKFSVCYCHTDS